MKRLITSMLTAAAILLVANISFAANDSADGSWMKDSYGWWYQTAEGGNIADAWLKDNGIWYHFGNDGYLQTGWIWDGYSWYYMNSSGMMQTGWVWDGNNWYYMNENGTMHTGWLQTDNSWYYFDPSGVLIAGTGYTDWLTDIHAAVSQIKAGTILSEETVQELGTENFFYVEDISDEIFDRMWKKSYKEDCTVPREDLRYIRCLHRTEEGVIKVGELVMNSMVADSVCDIFRQLYEQFYPIESMLLVDDFDADDDLSIMHNNTSAFNYRTVDDTDIISDHAYGLAVDINPYYNVYYIPSENYIFPPDGWDYLDREADFPYKLTEGDLCFNLFLEAGFSWGGWFANNVDYQHFYYTGD